MNIKRSLDHLIIGITFAILGSLLGLLLVESYWLYKGHKLGTAWHLLSTESMRSNMLILSQVPNVFVFFAFYQTKRNRSAYGVMLFIILVGIAYGIYSWF